MKTRHANYLKCVFANQKERDKLIGKAMRKLSRIDFDAIVVTGVSGITFGSILAHRMKKNLVVVRKDNDRSHSTVIVEGAYDGMRYVFVDDFVACGSTLCRVSEFVKAETKNSVFVTYYMYHWHNDVLNGKNYHNLTDDNIGDLTAHFCPPVKKFHKVLEYHGLTS